MQFKKTLFYSLTFLLTVLGIFLFSMAKEGIDFGKIATDKIQVYVTSKTTLQKVVAEVPHTSIADLSTNSVQIPNGESYEYINVFLHKEHVASAIYYSGPPHFSFAKYVAGVKRQLIDYTHGKLGYAIKAGQLISIHTYIGVMMKRSLSYLIPGFILAVFVGIGLAYLASIHAIFGRNLDRIHAVLLTIPDFFLIALIWIATIFFSQWTTQRLVLVVAFNNEVPFLIPFLTISLIPSIIIYGTMRIAITREWTALYVKTAFAKGLTASYIVRKHLLRNTWEDLIAILPKAFTIAIASMAVAEVICLIVGLGGFMKNPYLQNVSALPLTSMILGGIVIAFHLFTSLLRKWLVVRVKEADE